MFVTRTVMFRSTYDAIVAFASSIVERTHDHLLPGVWKGNRTPADLRHAFLTGLKAEGVCAWSYGQAAYDVWRASCEHVLASMASVDLGYDLTMWTGSAWMRIDVKNVACEKTIPYLSVKKKPDPSVQYVGVNIDDAKGRIRIWNPIPAERISTASNDGRGFYTRLTASDPCVFVDIVEG